MKLSWSQPIICGQGTSGGGSAVVGEDFEGGGQGGGTGGGVLEEGFFGAVGVSADRRAAPTYLDDRVGVGRAGGAVGVAEFTYEGGARRFGLVGGVEAQGIVAGVGGDPPENLLEGVQRQEPVGERGGRGIEAIIAAGAGAQELELGGVEEEDLEADQAGAIGRGNEVVDGGVEATPFPGSPTTIWAMPIWESTGQASVEKSARVHWGVA